MTTFTDQQRLILVIHHTYRVFFEGSRLIRRSGILYELTPHSNRPQQITDNYFDNNCVYALMERYSIV